VAGYPLLKSMMTMAADVTTTTTTASNSSNYNSNSNNISSTGLNSFKMAVISLSTKVSIVKQLQQRLVLLTDNSSRESLQTIARWMAFHRKYSLALSTALMSCIQDQLLKSSIKRAFMYLSVAHDVILMGSVEDSTTKATSDMWEKMKQFRLHLLQLVFAPMAIALCEGSFLDKAWKEKFNEMIVQWESCMSQDEVLYPMIQEIIVTIHRTTETAATIPNKNDEQEEEFVTSMSDTTTDVDVNKYMIKQEKEEDAIPTSNVSPPSSSLETDEIKVEPLEKVKTEPTLHSRDLSDNAIQIKNEEEQPTEDSCVASSPNKKQRVTETTAAATEEAFGSATIGSVMASTVDTSVVVDFEKEVC